MVIDKSGRTWPGAIIWLTDLPEECGLHLHRPRAACFPENRSPNLFIRTLGQRKLRWPAKQEGRSSAVANFGTNVRDSPDTVWPWDVEGG